MATLFFFSDYIFPVPVNLSIITWLIDTLYKGTEHKFIPTIIMQIILLNQSNKMKTFI